LKLLVDGWSILILYKEGILVFFITMLGLGSWGFNYFFKPDHRDLFLQTITILSLGSLLLTWVSLVLMLLGRLWIPILTIASILLPLACLIYLLWISWRKRAPSIDRSNIPAVIGFGSLFFVYLLVRLAFLKDIILPPYDDSPDHFLIVRDLLNPADPNRSIFHTLSNITENYYHIGFHSIAAWLTSASHMDPAMSMSLLGQVFIFISSLSILYLTFVMTGNLSAGFVAAGFAAVAWKMPGFAANWGKYPAIMGLELLPAWLGLLSFPSSDLKKKSMSIAFPILIVLGLSLIHTRLIICLIIIGISYFFSSHVNIKRLSTALQLVIVIGATLLIPFLFLKPVLVFYSNNYYLAFGISALLLPFASLKYPQHMISISLSMLGIWFASRVPVFFGLYGTNWLDAPFVEILLYIPFSLVAGLGYSGLWDKLKNYPVMKKLSLIVPAIILISGFSSLKSFYPDDCCNYVTRSDLNAIKWIKEDTEVDSVVWIAGFKPRNYMIGTDAGVWVFALTGRNVNKLPYDFDWNSSSVLTRICQRGYRDVYFYKGAMPFSFGDPNLSTNRLFEAVYRSGSIIIYRIRCD
jgi:hypothetical protein